LQHERVRKLASKVACRFQHLLKVGVYGGTRLSQRGGFL
jgi:hypothetical protein